MSKTTQRQIKFKLNWRGREPGHVDKDLDYGVQQMLVQRQIAEWYTEPKKRSAKKSD